MSQIKNKTRLIENGETNLLQKARKLVLESFEHGLLAAEPKRLIHSKLSLEGSILSIEKLSFDLNQYRNIFVVGGGKAGGAMAEGLEKILGKRITAGEINVPYNSKQKTGIIKISETSHPVPDLAGVEGTRRIIAIAEQANEDDLIICLISGGGSSLMPLPHDGVSLEDKKALTNALIRSGAPITDINTVRKHISAFKGGWLAKKAYPASVLNLILSDVVGDPLEVIASGPTVPDHTTFREAKSILEKRNLWTTTSGSIRKIISDGIKGIIEETPKPWDPAFKKVHNIILGNVRTASLAVLDYLKSKELKAQLLTTALEGEAKNVGTSLASIACEVDSLGKPFSKPVGIVAGGETTVTVIGKGSGGRNQELALSAALGLTKTKNCVVASLSTDGVDGPTDAAGAIVDSFTILRAKQVGLDAQKALLDNNSYQFFSKIDDLIITEPTGTNVNDIIVIIVL